MKNQKKQSAIIWLTRNGFYLFTPQLESIINLNFPKDTVNYLEVVNEEKFSQLIQSFSQQYHLPPLSVFIIIGPDVLIDKEIDTNQLITDKNLEKKILDCVPFESSFATNWLTGNKTHIVAFNANFYQQLKQVFNKIGWSIISLTPYFFIGQTSFNQSLAVNLLKNTQPLLEKNLIKTQVYGEYPPAEENHLQKNSQKSLLPYLLIIFLVLLGILIFTLFNRPKTKTTSLPKITPIIKKTLSPTISPSATSSAVLSPIKTPTPTAILNKNNIHPSPTPNNYPITITP